MCVCIFIYVSKSVQPSLCGCVDVWCSASIEFST